MKSAVDAVSQDRWLDILRARLGADAPEQLTGTGNAALLDEPLLGFIASRECPGHILLETLDSVPGPARAERGTHRRGA